ncbi:FKBP-type peptidyl-prolyl cis-trans isomerase [Membranicola marinus]|uniref:Peptidyl-prolyl cis-trans isomerase n=1 Tax=Membranihabitans marinus TaxID=1227546 RepID=A0A953LAP0_9BACT|nr:FKBP-type peptidyl-prolyl cis-trans isomerase [Membranihabitans marinus]MBY5960165.1 FKBP-type peptidyl-prolyl cis-trans isomerase [Membranihabitans marinus]
MNKQVKLFSLLFSAIALMMACGTDQSEPTVEGTTEDGFRYNIYKTGSSNDLPQPTQYVYFKAGVLLDDTSVLQPLSDIVRFQIPADTTPVDQVNPIVNILQQMSVGDSANVYVDLDSIPQAKMQFPDNKYINNYFLVQDIVDEETALDAIAKEKEENMIKMQKAKEKSGKVDSLVGLYLDKYKKGELDSDLQKLESGLEIYTIEPGSGDPVGNNQVEVHYWGVLEEDGKMFDNSYDRGMPFPLTVGAGSVIKGWDEGVAKLHPGEEALLFIPSELGYGEQGAGGDIPANADLVFFVEVLKKES